MAVTEVVHVLFPEGPPRQLGRLDAVCSRGDGPPRGPVLYRGDLHVGGQLSSLSVLAEGEFPIVLVSESQFLLALLQVDVTSTRFRLHLIIGQFAHGV